MIDAQKTQQSGVKIIDVHFVLDWHLGRCTHSSPRPSLRSERATHGGLATPLSENFTNHVRGLDTGQALFQSPKRVHESTMIDA